MVAIIGIEKLFKNQGYKQANKDYRIMAMSIGKESKYPPMIHFAKKHFGQKK